MSSKKLNIRLETGLFEASGYEAFLPLIKIVESFFPQPTLLETTGLKSKEISGFSDPKVRRDLDLKKNYMAFENKEKDFHFAILQHSSFKDASFHLTIDLEYCYGKENELIQLFREILNSYPIKLGHIELQSFEERLNYSKYYEQIRLPFEFRGFKWYQFISKETWIKISPGANLDENKYLDEVTEFKNGFLVRVGSEIRDFGSEKDVQQRLHATLELPVVKAKGNAPEVIFASITDALAHPLEVVKIKIENYHGVTSHPMPREISGFKNIESYDINCSLEIFTEVPDEIGELKKLRELFLFQTCVRKISPRIGELTELRKLHLACEIKNLPDEFCNLENLEELFIYSRELESLPKEFGRLKNLKVLRLFRCPKLTALPESIGQLSNLIEFNLNDIPIKVVPESLAGLTRLEKIILDSCDELDINQALTVFCQLPNVKYLNLSNCSFSYLPPQIGLFTNLEFLDLTSNWSLKDIPAEISGLKNWQIIRVSRYSSELKKKIKSHLPGGKLVTKWRYEGEEYSNSREYNDAQRYVRKGVDLIWDGKKVVEFS